MKVKTFDVWPLKGNGAGPEARAALRTSSTACYRGPRMSWGTIAVAEAYPGTPLLMHSTVTV